EQMSSKWRGLEFRIVGQFEVGVPASAGPEGLPDRLKAGLQQRFPEPMPMRRRSRRSHKMMFTASLRDVESREASMAEIPLVRKVRQVLDQPVIKDISAAVREQLLGSKLQSKLKPGAKVAVAVGSRGIANIKQIALQTVRTIKSMGAEPFIVAGMGTHG